MLTSEVYERDNLNESYHELGITKENPVLPCFSNMAKPIELYPYQIVAVNWMLRQESTLSRGGILGDDYRLGKVCEPLTHSQLQILTSITLDNSNVRFNSTLRVSQGKSESKRKGESEGLEKSLGRGNSLNLVSSKELTYHTLVTSPVLTLRVIIVQSKWYKTSMAD